ncbi:hypothetical protein E8E12_000160 [Didymella heteroderae]|uniref:Uncharacterized protein n=1 Tax=Didymella heteroderae TaxID=1769908 RepID=A0A9P4WR57_9PLEO|nr:hypothetical protein E8E12_000160 [Didymella heteroderae]
MPFDADDDEYVANLLAQDAKKTTKTYELVGLDAFNPKRSRAAMKIEQLKERNGREITRGTTIEGVSTMTKTRKDLMIDIEERASLTLDLHLGQDHLFKSRRRSHNPASDSDPLEAIVGPPPPPPKSTVRSRGRGALKGNSLGIESRFSTDYDPSLDLKPGSDVEDDWGEALEVMRDRERWKQQGADRLRAAGFKDEQVKKWEKGGNPMEEDVVWKKKGQDREWDRGKVVDDDGDVALKVAWGRLK